MRLSVRQGSAVLRVAVFLVALLSAVVFAQDLPKIAVYVTGDVSESEKKALGTKMLAELVNSGRYIGIERSTAFLAEIDKEQIKQRSGAIDDKQISQLGRQFGVKYVCIADINPALGAFQISARIVDVETAQVAFIGESNSALKTLDDLTDVSVQVVKKMFGGGTGEPKPKTVTQKPAPEPKQHASVEHRESVEARIVKQACLIDVAPVITSLAYKDFYGKYHFDDNTSSFAFAFGLFGEGVKGVQSDKFNIIFKDNFLRFRSNEGKHNDATGVDSSVTFGLFEITFDIGGRYYPYGDGEKLFFEAGLGLGWLNFERVLTFYNIGTGGALSGYFENESMSVFYLKLLNPSVGWRYKPWNDIGLIGEVSFGWHFAVVIATLTSKNATYFTADKLNNEEWRYYKNYLVGGPKLAFALGWAWKPAPALKRR